MRKSNFGLILILVLVFISCSEQKELLFETCEFELKGYDWMPTPYKFSSVIQDSVSHKRGHQYTATEYAYIGDIEKMLKEWDMDSSPRDTLTEIETNLFATFESVAAKPLIIEKAKKTKVTIINEAHHMPQHRVFTTELLQELYNVGYRHLGMESFLSSRISDSTLLANKYPILTNGGYVREPQYGNIIRQAIKIGYKVFGYESNGHENSKEREMNQARNIESYMELNPEGKYLIHCGYAHGAEGVYGRTWEKAMAGRLTEYTGLNPLTIEQTSYSEKSKRIYENKYFQHTEVSVPSVFISKDSIFGKFRKGMWFDISIFHPRTKNFDRAEWLLTGNRKIKKLEFENAEINCPCLVFAYLEGEEVGKAIPYDIQETKNKEVNLVLEKGKYNVILLNEQGVKLKTEIEI